MMYNCCYADLFCPPPHFRLSCRCYLGKTTTSLYLPPEEESYLLHVFKGLPPPHSFLDANTTKHANDDATNPLHDNPVNGKERLNTGEIHTIVEFSHLLKQ